MGFRFRCSNILIFFSLLNHLNLKAWARQAFQSRLSHKQRCYSFNCEPNFCQVLKSIVLSVIIELEISPREYDLKYSVHFELSPHVDIITLEFVLFMILFFPF